MKKWIVAALCLLSLSAQAQNAVTQKGSVLNNNIAKWVGSRQAADGGNLTGDNTGNGVNPFAITDLKEMGLAINDAKTSLPYRSLQFGHDSSGNAVLKVESANGATPGGFYCDINGVISDCLAGVSPGAVWGAIGAESANPLSFGTGSRTNIFNTGLPTVLSIAQGTDVAPVTTGGQQIRLWYRHNVDKSQCADNSANAGCIAPITINTSGGSTTNMVTNAITAYAETYSTMGLGAANSQAIDAIGWARSGSNAAGMGLYAVGVREEAAGRTRGAELSSWVFSGDDCASAAYGTNVSSECIGLHMGARGPLPSGPLRVSSLAIQINKGNEYGQWIDGIGFNAGSVRDNSFNDQSNSQHSINIGGNHSHAAIGIEEGSNGIGIGTTTPASLLHITGALSRPAYATSGAGLRSGTGFMITDTTSSGSSTPSNYVHALAGATLLATSPTTYAVNATLALGLSVPSTNVTITNNYALYSAKSLISSVVLNEAAPTTLAGQLGLGSTVAAASSCGSLAGADGCLLFNLAGVPTYVPYYQ